LDWPLWGGKEGIGGFKAKLGLARKGFYQILREIISIRLPKGFPGRFKEG